MEIKNQERAIMYHKLIEINLYRYSEKTKTNQEMYQKFFVEPFKKKGN